MKSAATIARKIRESPDTPHSRADMEALHAHVGGKLLKQNPNATNLDFLHALIRETHKPEELAEFHSGLEAEQATHRERMGAHETVTVDLRKLDDALELLAQAIGKPVAAHKAE